MNICVIVEVVCRLEPIGSGSENFVETESGSRNFDVYNNIFWIS
jgi:hypothetical protein